MKYQTCKIYTRNGRYWFNYNAIQHLPLSEAINFIHFAGFKPADSDEWQDTIPAGKAAFNGVLRFEEKE